MADYAIHEETLTDIADVIRKKEGSASLIDPADYADRINLMGMLPEKTASGAIAHIEDGADGVPLKNWLVTLPASLSGYSEVNAKQAKKNFYPIKIGADRFTNNGSATHSNDNGTLVIVASTGSASGVYIDTSDTLCEARNVLKWFYDNSYPKTISFDVVADADNISFRITSGSNSLVTIGTTPSRVSHVSTGNNLSLYAVNNSATIRISNLQIEYGSTATSYEAYEAPTQYTASLGRTIYGGQADIVTGEGVDYGLWVNMSDIAWTEDPNRLGVFYGTVAGRKTATADDPSPVIGCTCYDVNNVNVTTGIDKYISGARSYGGNIIFFRDSAFSGYTRAQVQEALQGEKVCVVSATQTPFTFTPITAETELGVNNFWADEGDSAVTYRADIDLALAQSSGTRGLMMASRSVSPMIGEEASLDRENILEEVYEYSDNEEETEEEET